MSPDVRNRKKRLEQTLASQSMDNFGFQSTYSNSHQNYYPQALALNQSFNAGDIGMQQFFTPAHESSVQHNLNHSQNFNIAPNRERNTTSGFYQDMRDSNFSTLQQTFRKNAKPFIPRAKQNKGTLNFETAKSPDTARLPNFQNTMQFSRKDFSKFSVKKLPVQPSGEKEKMTSGDQNYKRSLQENSLKNTFSLASSKDISSVTKFRRNNLWRNKSRQINISGVRTDMTRDLIEKLQSIGEIIELKMKWLERGDMQVKFKDEASARQAMEELDGIVIDGSRLQVTRAFQLQPTFRNRLKGVYQQTWLQQIKEDEDSDDPDQITSNSGQSFPQTIDDISEDNHEIIEKNINDIIDNEDDQNHEENFAQNHQPPHEQNLNFYGKEHYNQPEFNENWNQMNDVGFYRQEDMANRFPESMGYGQQDYNM